MLSRGRAERKPNHQSQVVVEGRGKEVSKEKERRGRRRKRKMLMRYTRKSN